MKCVLLAAGFGTRLRTVTGPAVPKILVPLNGRPLLEHQLRYLAAQGASEVAINLHHGAEQIAAYLDRAELDVAVRLSVEPELLGTAGALWPLADFLDETFVVLYGDVVTDLDLREFVADHRSRSALATLACYRSSELEGKGVVVMEPDQRVRSFSEKAPVGDGEHLVNAGIYALEPEILEFVPRGEADFGFDVWPPLIAAGALVYAQPITAYLRDVGTPEVLAATECELARGSL